MTPTFPDVAKRAHKVETLARLQQRIGNDVVTLADNLELADWRVQVDATRAVRRNGSCTLADPDSIYQPLTTANAVAPYGTEFVIRQRFVGARGPTDWQSLGTFTIQKPETNDDGIITTQLMGDDRSAKVAEARLIAPYTVEAGTNVATAIQTLISSRVSGLTYAFASTSATTPLLVLNEQDDPWQRAQEMASSAGLELYFDPDGVCTLRVPPDPASPLAVPAVVYADGEDSILTQVGVQLDTSDSYSHAVFIGEGPDNQAPVRADAYDDDPASPTYYLGPFGDKPVFLRTQIVSPDPALAASQAVQSAQSLLNRKRGGFMRVTFQGVPIPTLEGSDLVRATRPESGVDQLLVLDSFSFSSDLAEEMPASTRAVRL